MSIHQLDQAIPALESGMSSSALLQVLSPRGSSRLRRVIGVTRYLSDDDRQAVLSFLAQGSGEDLGETIQAPGSEQILGMLKTMKEEMEKDLAEATSQEDSANAENFLSTMKEQCASMEKNKALRQKMRSDEVAAISEAIKILNDDDALEVFSKAKPAALMQKRQTYDAFLQLGSTRATEQAASKG